MLEGWWWVADMDSPNLNLIFRYIQYIKIKQGHLIKVNLTELITRDYSLFDNVICSGVADPSPNSSYNCQSQVLPHWPQIMVEEKKIRREREQL